MTGRTTPSVVDQVRVDPALGRIYAEGWQSWSPTTWHPVGTDGPRPTEEWVATMRFRPGTPVLPAGVQGEGLVVVDPGTGAPALSYGAVAGRRVPTVHAVAHGDRVTVHCDAPDALEVDEHAGGAERPDSPSRETSQAGGKRHGNVMLIARRPNWSCSR